ncbi:MAG TPA: hypothetical protein DF383_00575, partial [Deltaproteobacteria bacterium]|nr:hypothetical protein [Deltaproteobacteria bacterium]
MATAASATKTGREHVADGRIKIEGANAAGFLRDRLPFPHDAFIWINLCNGSPRLWSPLTDQLIHSFDRIAIGPHSPSDPKVKAEETQVYQVCLEKGESALPEVFLHSLEASEIIEQSKGEFSRAS